MKKLFIIIILLVAGAVGWYLLSPIWRVVQKDEPSPLDTALPTSSLPSPPSPPVVKDRLESMGLEEKKEFEKQVEMMKDKVMEMKEPMVPEAKLMAQGDFIPRAHDVKGKALLIGEGEKKILRFEDFETINGPKLHIYLSSDLGNDDFIDLGAIRATKGNVNYEIADTVDTKKYNKVLVWCVTFSVLFSYAQLN